MIATFLVDAIANELLSNKSCSLDILKFDALQEAVAECTLGLSRFLT